ncbi:MAG TPA: DUF4012 domain-containing protein, partial [Patescibacteria group bacterium]|nr:DUF4012 domain-containing protein [Patescibacteria group bacterium]
MDQNKKKLFSEDLQQELEELSWEFLLKEREEQANKAAEILAKNKEASAGDRRGYEEQDEIGMYYSQQPRTSYQNFDFWQRSDETNINDLRRDSGIIFNEEKLKAHRVVEWTKAPRLKEPKPRVIARILGKIILAPVTISVGMTTFVGKTVIGVGEIIYKILKGAVVLGWQMLAAFKDAFVYIFGDFSWLKRQELATEVSVINEIRERVQKIAPRYRGKNWRLHAVGTFAVVAILLVLPLQGYLFFNRAEKIKGEVLGASEAGVAHLWQAGVAGKNLDMQSAGREFTLAGQEFVEAQSDFKKLGLVANSAAGVVPEIKAGEQLLSVAIKSAEIGQILMKTGQAMSDFAQKIDYQQAGIEIQGNAIKVKTADKGKQVDWLAIESELDKAVAKAAEIEETIRKIDLDNTKLAVYKEQLALVQSQMPAAVGLLQNYRDLTKVMMGILGVDEPKRWLFVFQNNAEIRPTGGFMGSYAIVDIKDGKIKDIAVPGGGFYDLKGSLAVQVDAPYPFHVFSPIWQPWNANWFPDWPTSAEKIMWFYDKSGGSSVDGVISFTPDVLEDLLKLTGQIEMPEYGLTVDGDNFMRTTQTQVEFNYDKEENKPKKFIGDLLPKVLDRVFTLTGEKRMAALETILGSLQEKDILVYFKNQTNQGIADKFGWSGRIAEYDKDYLA